MKRAAAKPSVPRRPQPSLAPLAATPADQMRRLNRWRETLNPLRGLTIQAAISRLDQAQRGIWADAQWTFQLIERRDEDLIAVIESTSGALTELNWYIRTCEGDPRRAAQWDDVLAAEQSALLLDRYNRILNLYEALDHLALAKFRGYAHVQIRAEGEWLDQVEMLDQWNVARDGMRGDWYWNPDAKAVPVGSLPPEYRLDPAAYLIVETPRPVDEVALIKYLRTSMSAKDWDAWIEIYGIPSWIVTLPPGVPAGKEDAYRDAAAEVAAGGSGALPHGSEAQAASAPGGTAPFREHMEWWSQRLVLAATGGLLTSVALPTGIGSGASDAHAETFARIARGRAKRSSEEFQRKIDRPILEEHFPGRPHLAYFEFDAREERDAAAIVDQVAKLAAAGLRVDPAQVEERTGYRVTIAPVAPLAPPPAPLLSRAASADASPAPAPSAATRAYAEAVRADLRPLAEAIWPLLDLEGDELRAGLNTLVSRRGQIADATLANTAAADLLERLLAEAAAEGILDAPQNPQNSP